MSGVNLVGVQFRRAGHIYDFAPGNLNLKVGDDVVVETDRGPSLAKVAAVRFAEAGSKDLKAILRVASRRDLEDARKLTPEAATSFARERADRIGLKMSVLQSEVQFGGNKVIVYFSAPGRVDFRELVKELASGLKARVELKQVGARDEAKLVGGVGVCGREFCCSSFLRDFVPVSIKMAKNQNLALNPSKVSGGCGRLLCCLTYENDLYTELRKELPPRNAMVRVVEDGVVGRVIKADLLNQKIVIETSDGQQVTALVAGVVPVEGGSSQVAAGGAEDEGGDGWGEDIDFATLAKLEEAEGARDERKQGEGREDRDERPSGARERERGGRSGGRDPRGPRNGGRS